MKEEGKNSLNKLTSPLTSQEGKKEGLHLSEVKKRILEGLNQKIEIIEELKRIINGVRLEENLETVSQRFNQYIEQVLLKYPHANKPLKEIKEFRMEIDKIETRLKELDSRKEKFSSAEQEEYFNLSEKLIELFDKIDSLKIYNKEDVIFLDNLLNGINHLIKNFSLIQKIRGDEERIIKEANKALFLDFDNEFDHENEEGIDKDKIKDIIINPFNITIILEEEYFEILNQKINIDKGENILGFHPIGIFNIVKWNKNSKDLSFIIQHENFHSLLEGFLPFEPSPFAELKNALENVDILKKLNVSPSIIEDAEQRKRRVLNYTVSDIIDRLHEELLADIDSIEYFTIHGDLHQVKLLADMDIVERFEFLLGEFYKKGIERKYKGINTAKMEILDIKRLLEEAMKNETDTDILKQMRQLYMGIDKAFNRVIVFMNKFLFISHYTKDTSKIHDLFVILKPSKFHHIETYLRYCYGDIVYEGWEALYKLLLEENFSLDTIKALINIKENIPKREAALLKYHFEHIDNFAEWTEKIGLKGCPLERVREYLITLELLNSILNIDSEKLKEFKRNVLWNFFFFYISESIKENFHTLPDLVNRLDFDERKTFEDAMESYFGDGFIYYDLENIYGKAVYSYTKESQEFVKSLPIWKELVKLNLDNIAQCGLSRYEKYKNSF